MASHGGVNLLGEKRLLNLRESLDKILKQKAMYYGLWQMIQKDTGEYAVGYLDNKPPSSRRFCGRSFETLKEAKEYWKLQVEK